MTREVERLAELEGVALRHPGQGMCFPYVHHLALSSPDEAWDDRSVWQAVHGEVRLPDGRWTAHAWVETGGRVFDWQNRHSHPRGVPLRRFLQALDARNMTGYTAESVLINCARHTQGPWAPGEPTRKGVRLRRGRGAVRRRHVETVEAPCAEVRKSQGVRVLDVLVLGPGTIAAAAAADELHPVARLALAGYGIATVGYNAKNWRATRRANRGR